MNIVVYANGPCVPTGFGTVVREIFTGMQVRQRVPITNLNFFAVNYTGDPHDLPFKIYPAQIAAARDPDLFGRQRFVNMLLGNAWPCDVLFLLEDTFTLMAQVVIDGQGVPMLPGLIDAMRKQVRRGRPPFRVIQYIPVDCDLLRPEWVQWMPGMIDAPVAYTAFGKRVICDRIPALDPGMRVIPHGTNPEVFYPLAPEERQQVRAQMGIAPGQPLLLCVQRNQPRKDVVKVLQVFAEVRKQVPEAILYCHMNVRDSAGFNLDIVAHDLRLPQGSLRFPGGFSEGQGVSVELLNQILNAGDVFLTAARGEGWGLTLTDAMTVGLPCVAPDHTSHSEILADGRGVLVPPLPFRDLMTFDNDQSRPVTDVGATAAAVVSLIQHAAEREAIGRRAREWALGMTWRNHVVPQWEEVFLEQWQSLQSVRPPEVRPPVPVTPVAPVRPPVPRIAETNPFVFQQFRHAA